MSVNKDVIANFAIDFYAAKSFDEAFNTFFKLIIDTGFDGVLFSYIPQISIASKLSIPPFFKASDKYLDFLSYYAEKRLDKVDFIIKAMKEGETNVLNWWEEAERRKVSAEEFGVLHVAREQYGITNGITIPTMSEQRGIAGAAIISSKSGDAYSKLISENIDTLVLCTKMFHDFTLSRPLSSNTFILPFFPSLTEKEILVLRSPLSVNRKTNETN